MNQASNALTPVNRVLGARSITLGPLSEWLCLTIDVVTITLTSIVTAQLYHGLLDVGSARIWDHATVGVLFAFIFATIRLVRNAYNVRAVTSGHLGFLELLSAWNMATFAVLALSFLIKTTSTYYSRGSLVLFYFGGLAGLVAARALLTGVVARGIRQSWLVTGKALLIGTPAALEDFLGRYDLRESGIRVVDAIVLPDREGPEGTPSRAAAFEKAVERVRAQRVKDVFLLVPWSSHETIEQAADAFLNVPAHLHLGAERILDRFADVEISHTGPVASLELTRPALGPRQVLIKRIFDATLALIALMALAPLFLVIGIFVKLDSSGKVFFRQRRYGFNQEQFEIIKFRSMTTTEDGADVKQVTRNDARVTRVGRFLRRTNLDELPQLINVLKGEMSFVGPRPHAIIHNQEYEQKITRYARRHNVKPGITGWAQVNGFRGETDTDDKMRARVRCDLYYIDNWSLALDAYIIFKTLFSARAYTNAH